MSNGTKVATRTSGGVEVNRTAMDQCRATKTYERIAVDYASSADKIAPWQSGQTFRVYSLRWMWAHHLAPIREHDVC